MYLDPIPTQPPIEHSKKRPFWLWGAFIAFFVIVLQLTFVIVYATSEIPLLMVVLGVLLGALAGHLGGKIGGPIGAVIFALIVGAALPICLVIAIYFLGAQFGGIY